MMAHADHQPPLAGAERADRTLVSCYELARGFQERGAVGRQANLSRRAFQQTAAEAVFKSLDLQAHGGLRRVQCLGGPREALEVGGRTNACTASMSSVFIVHSFIKKANH